jgi:hypothetical protein
VIIRHALAGPAAAGLRADRHRLPGFAHADLDAADGLHGAFAEIEVDRVGLDVVRPRWSVALVPSLPHSAVQATLSMWAPLQRLAGALRDHDRALRVDLVRPPAAASG